MSEIYQNAIKSFAYICLVIELSKGREITGYDIIVYVKKFGLEVSPGTVYHHLEMLENLGIIRAKPQRRKRGYKALYSLTEKGKRIFEGFKEKWKQPIKYVYENIVGTE